MHWLVKLLVVLIIIAMAAGLLNLWFNTFYLGSYYLNAGIGLVVLGLAFPLVVVIGGYYLIRLIVKA